MARVAKMPPRELEICQRLRAFREGMMIARTVFAAKVGLGNQRLESYERGRVPLRFDVFKAINRVFPVSAKWLVTGEGSISFSRPLDDTMLTVRVDGRALLSEVYDQSLKQYFDGSEAAIFQEWCGVGALFDSLSQFSEAIEDDEDSRRIPDAVLGRIDGMLRSVRESIAWEVSRREAERKRTHKTGSAAFVGEQAAKMPLRIKEAKEKKPARRGRG